MLSGEAAVVATETAAAIEIPGNVLIRTVLVRVRDTSATVVIAALIGSPVARVVGMVIGSLHAMVAAGTRMLRRVVVVIDHGLAERGLHRRPHGEPTQTHWAAKHRADALEQQLASGNAQRRRGSGPQETGTLARRHHGLHRRRARRPARLRLRCRLGGPRGFSRARHAAVREPAQEAGRAAR